MASERFWIFYRDRLQFLKTNKPHDILLVTADPVEAIASVFASFLFPTRLWLGNPTWGQQEWQQVATQMQPDLIWGQLPEGIWHQEKNVGAHSCAPLPVDVDITQLLIPTGGSSGNLKFAIHTWETLMVAVQGFRQHFQVDQVDAYCVLPLYHVSGLMQVLRCWVSGGRLMLQPFRELMQQPLPEPGAGAFLSLVPTQLQRLLDAGHSDWLRQFRAILLGGAHPWPNLLNQARQQQLPLAPTYGMTETAAQVATLLPEEFLTGQTSSGRSLPHVTLTIQSATGEVLSPGQIGHITLQTNSLALQYVGAPLARPFQPEDLGCLDEAGYLTVIGRQGSLINTGGEKVLPEEVEAVIRATGQVADVAVLGVADADWGERVTAIVVPSPGYELDKLRHQLKQQLSPAKQPKHWLQQTALPRNAQGKLNRQQLQDWVQRHCEEPANPGALGATGSDSERSR
ncbi:MAG: AMP-binding protein [Leptolyngbyaceae cyanobacterium]